MATARKRPARKVLLSITTSKRTRHVLAVIWEFLHAFMSGGGALMWNTFLASVSVFAAAMLISNSALPHAPQKGFRKSGLTKTEAEDLLDWLEVHGRRQMQLCYVTGEGF